MANPHVMKHLQEYQKSELLKGKLLIDSFKQLRNDFYLSLYCRQRPKELASFLERLKKQTNHKNIILTIAFERPEMIKLLIERSRKTFQDALLIVVDNSRSTRCRKQIKELCKAEPVPYIALPANHTKHANRSHSKAMQWCYENIIKEIEPDLFGFLDHDLIPLRTVNFSQLLQKQPFYGVLWESLKTNAWQLWAGYCLFNYKQVSRYKLNFLYDFSNGLDTGGRNYHNLYRFFDRNDYSFPTNKMVSFMADASTPVTRLHIIDDNWIHFGGAGYRDNFNNRHAFFKEQLATLDSIENWSIFSFPCFFDLVDMGQQGEVRNTD